MTFELLLKPMKVERKPYLLLLFTFLITTIAILLAYNIFPRSSSVLVITFCIIPLIPIMVKLIEMEELRFERSKRMMRLKNYKIIRIYAYLFLGFIIAFSFWYTFLPFEKSSQIFSEQISTLYERQPADSSVVGSPPAERFCNTELLTVHDEYEFSKCMVYDYSDDGKLEYLIWLKGDKDPSLVYIVSEDKFMPYTRFIRNHFFWNNLRLLMIIFLTSFIFGSGALFILTWNASIIGVFVGESAIRFANLFSKLPFSKVPAFFTALHLSLGKLLLHGIPEVLGFFLAALAGGILSAAFLRHKTFDKGFIKIMLDSLTLSGISVALIFIAAVIESIVL